MRETMQFQLSDTFSNHLIKYDDVRKKTIKQEPKKPKKPNPYPLGLPPLDQLIPYDVLPYGTKRKEEIIKMISRCSPEHRYTHMSYPKVTDKYPQIGKEDHLFKETDRRVTWDGHRVKRHVMIYHYEGMWTCLWIEMVRILILITSMVGLGMNVNRSKLVKLIGDTKQYM